MANSLLVRLILTVSLVLATSLTHADGPKPTVEGAHNFLKYALNYDTGTKHIVPKHYYSYVFKFDSSSGSPETYTQAPLPTMIEKSSGCKTQIKKGSTAPEVEYGKRSTTYNTYVHGVNFLFDTGIDWSKVVEVKKTGLEVTIFGLEPGNFTFIFSTENLASRAVYAMEFLRFTCDPMTDSAF